LLFVKTCGDAHRFWFTFFCFFIFRGLFPKKSKTNQN
jgi:hypothetical protein